MQPSLRLLNEVIATFDWRERTDFTGITSIHFLCDNDIVIAGNIIDSIQNPPRICVRFHTNTMARYHFGATDCSWINTWINVPNKSLCFPPTNDQNQMTSRNIIQNRTSSDLQSHLNLSNIRQNERCLGNPESIKTCETIKRLIHALKHCSSLDIINNKQHQNMFTEYMDKISRRILDDYHHLIQYHEPQLHEITQRIINKEGFELCRVKECAHTARHQSVNVQSTNECDSRLRFYVQTMDSLHFYLFHLYESGLRVHVDDHMDMDDDDTKLFELVDSTKHITADFPHFAENNKFNISPKDIISSDNMGKKLFIEDLIKYLLQKGADKTNINCFKTFIICGEYDSDTIAYDILKIHSNISHHLKNKYCAVLIKKFVTIKQNNASSFNIGLRFYYWDYYKSIKQIPDKEQFGNNLNDHSGYNICDLYIEKKYNCFKEEISHYPYITWRIYNQRVVIKAKKYQTTNAVRRLSSVEQDMEHLHYDITAGSSFGFENLLCLILYTDFNDLSTHFSETFRPLSPFEGIDGIKLRNREYYWWSKILRETVELFGYRRYSSSNLNIDRLFGPFYAGMLEVMPMPQINIRLCGPTSTSVCKDVAVKFSSHNGMVIQLNNNVWPSDLLRGFDCSWISRYKDELERLFFGGFVAMNVQSVLIKKTRCNYYYSFSALLYLDAILSGSKLSELNATRTDILKSLIAWKLNSSKETNLNQYVYNTFECLCNNKKQIVLDLFLLSNGNETMVDLVMCSIESGINKHRILDGTCKTNLFRPIIFGLFENIETIVIDTHKKWCLSLSRLLSLLVVYPLYSLKQVIVKARGRNNWISETWQLSSKILTQQYSEKQFTVSMKSVSTRNAKEDWLIINRK